MSRKFLDNSNRSFAPRTIRAADNRSRHSIVRHKRGRALANRRENSFVPPEDWHEPAADNGTKYQVLVQPPGDGFRHVLTEQEIRRRLARLPSRLLEPLDVIQLSRVTRKKLRFPCYGMQWGTALYLYPIETSLVEYFDRPPRPAQRIETQMYGGRWMQESSGLWKLVWTEAAIKNFYLNNILMHELGHLLDDRNTSYVDRERYAEWFAIQHGYKSSHREAMADKTGKSQIRRRHHSKR